MSMARTDETDLLLPLYGGIHEEPRWATFLGRLRRRVRADHAALIFGQGESPIYQATQWFSGRDIGAEAQTLGSLPAADPIPYHRLRPGRVYSAAEMIDADDARHERFRRDYLERLGLRFGRFMRVSNGGANAWLTAARSDADFQAADSALLSGLAPHLTTVLQTTSVLEQLRQREAIAHDALVRAKIGWRAVDDGGRIIDAGGTPTPSSEDMPQSRLTIPPARLPVAAGVIPSSVVLSRSPPRLGPGAAEALTGVSGLSRSEARLACRMAAGESLEAAAAALGLTIETARNYSKSLYAKTGARGQGPLVAWVLANAATLAEGA